MNSSSLSKRSLLSLYSMKFLQMTLSDSDGLVPFLCMHNIGTPNASAQPNSIVLPVEIEETSAMLSEMQATGRKIGVLAKQEHENMYEKSCMKVLGPEEDGRTCASRLFHLLREFDAEEVDVIIAEAVSEKGLGLAVMNRLKKAAGPDQNLPPESF